jgi:hypothetical protein
MREIVRIGQILFSSSSIPRNPVVADPGADCGRVLADAASEHQRQTRLMPQQTRSPESRAPSIKISGVFNFRLFQELDNSSRNDFNQSCSSSLEMYFRTASSVAFTVSNIFLPAMQPLPDFLDAAMPKTDIMKAEIGGRHRLPLLAPLRGAIVIPFVSRWYRPLSRAQPPANGFEPSGFAFDRCSKRSAPLRISSVKTLKPISKWIERHRSSFR